MASTTPNIGLTLPTGTEGWKRSVINGNFTILDTKIGAVGNTPLQTQINTLSSQLGNVAFKKGSLPSTATATFNISNGGRNIIFFVDSSSTRQAAYIVTGSAVGAVFYKAIATGADITISTDTNTFTVNKPANSTPMYLIINLQGEMPTVS